ncbi:Protein of unknown function [Propionibacterium freudenreichii]|nr:Protein of unknown function [Propionibacterium freudenreichii]CEI24604.1 Protein of unknown function [Propionibacterium freudenreichii]CEI47207.1 Protein of unknown function [Propionibacterium freudenreichii]
MKPPLTYVIILTTLVIAWVAPTPWWFRTFTRLSATIVVVSIVIDLVARAEEGHGRRPGDRRDPDDPVGP